MTEYRNGNGWPLKALTVSLLIISALAGWLWTANTTAIAENARKQSDQAVVIQQSQERIATLEEAVRGLTRQMDRIEAGVEDRRRRDRSR